ncbi:unnamed protein product [Tetraodon nigroviridis]|uniref:(spotted green pufferfish) hypothetical protein n=1 Tax=Tetraodon nigroviridis TaxID=99883 RepID=Q4REV9_TETNG|nr:unnamed protein product [Tetraodon nigroviridis]
MQCRGHGGVERLDHTGDGFQKVVTPNRAAQQRISPGRMSPCRK